MHRNAHKSAYANDWLREWRFPSQEDWRLQWYVIVWVIRGKSASAKIETHTYAREMNKEKAKGWRGADARVFTVWQSSVQKLLREWGTIFSLNCKLNSTPNQNAKVEFLHRQLIFIVVQSMYIDR